MPVFRSKGRFLLLALVVLGMVVSALALPEVASAAGWNLSWYSTIRTRSDGYKRYEVQAIGNYDGVSTGYYVRVKLVMNGLAYWCTSDTVQGPNATGCAAYGPYYRPGSGCRAFTQTAYIKTTLGSIMKQKGPTSGNFCP